MCESFCMSTQPDASPGVPAWDTADRMRKALRHSGVGVEEMASYLDVTRRSVGNWVNGHVKPSKQTLRLWALRTGVSYDWLCHGTEKPCFDGNQSGISAGQRGVMIPCSSPPTLRAIRLEPVHRDAGFKSPVALPVAA